MTQNDSSDSNQDERTARFRRIRTTKPDEETLPPRSVPASASTAKADAQSPAAATPKTDPFKAHPKVDALSRLRQTQQVKPVEDSAPAENPPAEDGSEPGQESRGKNLLGQTFKMFNLRRKSVETPAVAAESAQTEEVDPAPNADGEPQPAASPRLMRFAPAFWTIASTISLTVNIILLVTVIILVRTVLQLNVKLGDATKYASLPKDTVKGLYDNFVKMDNAHIKADIPVSINVPVQFDLTINTQTEVVLSQDTPISQARVTLTTGGLNITNAPASIVLPAGTRLPINLSLVVPVDKSVPVSLVVPVDIALANTDLHDPFTGLRTVVQPLYCLLDPQAVDASGVLICTP